MPQFASRRLASFFPPVTTDKDGRFQIKGIGRERIATLIVEGPTIETQAINVVTRPGVASFHVGRYGDLADGRIVYQPPTFAHAAAPGRVVTGVVRDTATRKPIAGAVVRLSENVPIANPLYFIKTTTDQQGRYRLTGLPRKLQFPVSNDLIALPPDGEPYLALRKGLPETDDKPAVFDFDLPRGVWLEGRVTDKATGRGVRARLGYFVFAGGPHDAEAQSLYIPPMPGLAHWTDGEGQFRIVAAPYRGLIGARVAGGQAAERYRVGIGADQIEGGKQESGTITFDTHPHTAVADDFDVLAEIKPAEGAKRVRCDLVLDPGRAVTVQVRGPDGKPLGGVRVFGRTARGGWDYEPQPADFAVHGLGPDERRTLLVQHAEKNLAARGEIKAGERGPIIVTLQPAGAVTGRVVDDGGRPLAHAAITVDFRLTRDGALYLHSHEFLADAEGKFRIAGLLPGSIYYAALLPREGAYRRRIIDALSLKGGETKDLGDVKPVKGDDP